MYSITRQLNDYIIELYVSDIFNVLKILGQYETFPIYYIRMLHEIRELTSHVMLHKILYQYPIYVAYIDDMFHMLRYYTYHTIYMSYVVTKSGTLFKLTRMSITRIGMLNNVESIFQTLEALCNKMKHNENIDIKMICEVYKYSRSIIDVSI